MKPPSPLTWLFSLCLLGGLGLLTLALTSGTSPRLVVYCAHDAVFSEGLLQEFAQRHRVQLDIRYDTEATKSLGLVNLIRNERQRPRCDVFWNNELLGTIDLQREGLTVPYRGAGWERMPTEWKDPEGHWVAFAARMRMLIGHPQAMSPAPPADMCLWDTGDGEKSMCWAVPLYGTTLTQFAIMSRVMGQLPLEAWRARMLKQGVREVAGNAAVRDAVIQKTSEWGWTDTDDAYDAIDTGHAIRMTPVEVAGKTICIPNSVAVIRGTRRLELSRKLVDFLTSADSELQLARSASRQIPLGPIAEELPTDVADLMPAAGQAWPLTDLLDDRQRVIAWLRRELAP